jgi:hypothetical protein
MGKVLLGVIGFVAIRQPGGKFPSRSLFLRIFSVRCAAQNAAHVPTSCAGRHFNGFIVSLADTDV